MAVFCFAGHGVQIDGAHFLLSDVLIADATDPGNVAHDRSSEQRAALGSWPARVLPAESPALPSRGEPGSQQ